MSERALFPKLNFFKKEVIERFLIATTEIYKRHPIYTYDSDDEKTEIIIIPAYGDVVFNGKKPGIIAKAGGYSLHLMDTIYQNMSKEYINQQGYIAGYKKEQIIPISLTIFVQALAEEESSNIADELAGLLVFACRSMYGQVGLVVKGAQISDTDLFDKDNDVYQTTVTVALDVPWELLFEDNQPPVEENIIFTDSCSGETEQKNNDGYRQPGVFVTKN